MLVSPPAISGDENFFGWTWWDIITLPFSRGGPFGPDDEDRTPLEMAVDQPENSPRALKNKLSRINKLLQNEPAPTTRDLDLALVRASYHSSAIVVQRLLDAGADVNARLDSNAFLSGESALIRASFNQDSSVARLLLDAGANPNIKRFMVSSGEGDSALMVAARVGNLDMITLLLAHGAEVNYHHNNCSKPCGSALIDAIVGHYLEAKDRRGEEIAIIDRRFENVIQLLLEHGADVNLAVGINQSPDTPLVVALTQNGSIFVPMLLNKGAQVNVQSNGCWPLIAAVDNGDFHSLELLLARGADVRALDKNGRNALVAAFKCYSCLDKKTDMIERLLAAGAPVNSKSGGLSTTLIEAINGARDTIRATFSISQSSLREQETKILLRLIELGADLDTVNMDGSTALSMAQEDKYSTVVEAIKLRRKVAPIVPAHPSGLNPSKPQ